MKDPECIRPDLPNLVDDYLNGKGEVGEFYAFSPNLKGTKKAAQQRQLVEVDRTLLVSVLSEQAERSRYSSELTSEQISRLADNDVFTITTGHQLCLLGGPMFFIYKILSVIRLSNMLAEEGIQTVPVYWMASEDHDFEEVNHIFLKGEKFLWNKTSSGAVGRLNLDQLSDFKMNVARYFEHDKVKTETLKKMDELFDEDKTLAEAIRDFVYWLFARYGVVVIDADDKRLKQGFKDVMESELFEQKAHRAMQQNAIRLNDLGYSAQVTPREVNLFWLDKDYRSRIVTTTNGFATSDGEKHWTAEEMKKVLNSHPENLSPNVVMRPLYQEKILPNLTYIGGPGELSYWLQLKGVFDAYHVFYPQVLLRDMAVILDEKLSKRMAQLAVAPDEVYMDKDVLFNRLVRQDNEQEQLINDTEKDVTEAMSQVISSLASFDPSLEESAKAEQAKIQRRFDTLRKKVIRSSRKQNHTTERRIEEFVAGIKPNGDPQERVANWLNFENHVTISKRLDELLKQFNPYAVSLKIVSKK
ncbi:MAG: bacillithiol biosynthesis cysteine-adding enzyme BshC [Salibacteraceae bacterium]